MFSFVSIMLSSRSVRGCVWEKWEVCWGSLTSSIKVVFQLHWKQFPAEGTFMLKLHSACTHCVCVSALSLYHIMEWHNDRVRNYNAMPTYQQQQATNKLISLVYLLLFPAFWCLVMLCRMSHVSRLRTRSLHLPCCRVALIDVANVIVLALLCVMTINWIKLSWIEVSMNQMSPLPDTFLDRLLLLNWCLNLSWHSNVLCQSSQTDNTYREN